MYTEWTGRCADLLIHHSESKGDVTLAWRVRLQRLIEETHELRRLKNNTPQTAYQVELTLKGIESQLNEWEAKVPSEALSSRMPLPPFTLLPPRD